MKICPNCRRAFNDDLTFCQYCGVSLPEATGAGPDRSYRPDADGGTQYPTGSAGVHGDAGDMPEFLKKYFEKGKKKLCRCLIYTAVLVLSIVLILLETDATAIAGALLFFSFLFSMFAWITYVQYPFSRKNYRRFLKYGNNGMLCGAINDEFMRRPDCNCAAGKEAIADRANGIRLIPYSRIAWMYVEDVRRRDTVMAPSVIVCTKDGETIRLVGTTEDVLHRILPDVMAISPNVIVGRGRDQKRQYKEMYRG